MNKVTFFLFLVQISAIFSQNIDYLVEFKAYLRDEKIPSILSEVLNKYLTEEEITTSDLIKLSKLDRYELEDIRNIVKASNISEQDVFNVNNLQETFKSLNISIIEFYQDLLQNLTLNNNQLLEILKELEVPPTDFLLSINFKNEEDVYNALRKGVYDEAHTNQTLEIIGKSLNDLYIFTRNKIVSKLKESPPKVALPLLQNFEFYYKILNLTISDVYEVEKFKEIFTNISETLQESTILGVFVEEKKIAVHQIAYEILSYMIDSYIKIELDNVEVSWRKTKALGEYIVELETNQTRSFVPITSNYTSFSNCFYVTLINGTVVSEEVDVNEFSVEKTPKMKFEIGSLLICDSFLYGLARDENATRIFFDQFYTTEQTTSNSSLSLQIYITFIVFIALLF